MKGALLALSLLFTMGLLEAGEYYRMGDASVKVAATKKISRGVESGTGWRWLNPFLTWYRARKVVIAPVLATEMRDISVSGVPPAGTRGSRGRDVLSLEENARSSSVVT